MKHVTITLAIALAFINTIAISVKAQSKPEINGAWKMNLSKSKAEEGIQGITVKFERQAASIHEDLSMFTPDGERKATLNYTLDGKESVNRWGSRDVKSTAKIDGDSLLLEWKGEGHSLLRKITVSQDGKTMTMIVRQITPGGEREDTIVLDKQ
jgi:hypothetical protein